MPISVKPAIYIKLKSPRPVSYLFLFLLLFLTMPAIAQETITYLLRSGQITMVPNLRQDLMDKELAGGRTDHYYYTLIGFDRLPNDRSFIYLKQQGGELLERFSDQIYAVRFKKSPSIVQLRTAGIKAVKNIPAHIKISENLRQRLSSSQSPGQIQISILFYGNESLKDHEADLQTIGFKLISRQYIQQGIYIGNVSVSQIERLASLPFVRHVNVFDYKATPLLQPETGAFGLTNLKGLQPNGLQLSGKGITAGVGDNADPTSHLDLLNNTINRNPLPLSGGNHGTRVSGIITGDGLVDECYNGVAPSAQLITDYYDYIITKAPVYKKDFGLSVTNNSYYLGYNRCPGNGAYNELSVYTDGQVYQDSTLLHVVAAGNDGALTCASYPLSYGTIKSGYQTGKNVLTVGNYYIFNPQGILASSSRGPVNDGRIKPEILAPGSNFYSTTINNNYNNGFGTSFSAPMITGVYSLLAERYKQLNNDALPHAGLMKAVLCNTATDRGQPGPDYIHGFGLVQPYRALRNIENKRYLKGTVSQGQSFIHTLAVPQGTTRLKVMLYWHDPSGSPAAPLSLQHDLDLQVTDQNQTYLPWVLNPAPDQVSSPAIRGTDRINNIEQVTFDNPSGTNLQIQVNGHAILNGPQDFYITWEFYENDIKLLHPIGGEKFTPGVTISYEAISWDAPDNSNENLLIEYTTNDGNTWTQIADNVPAKSNWFFWTIPNIAVAKAKVRITRKSDNSTYVTPGTFTIIGRPTLTSAIPCEGAVNLSWNAIANATDYEVFQLKDYQWEKKGTTSALQYNIRGLDRTTRYWFSVRPRITDSAGRRTRAIAVTPSVSTPCTAAEFDKDLKVDLLVSPVNGRKFTQTELTSEQEVIVKIKNLDNVVSSTAYEVGYQINDGPIIIEQSAIPIPASSSIDYLFTTKANLSATDSFRIRAYVKQTGDQRTENDEQTFLVRHLENTPVTLPHVEDFEGTNTDEYKQRSFGLKNIARFDYDATTSNGRLRTFINTGIAPQGNKAITLDAAQYLGSANLNQLTGTFNCSELTLSEGLRLDFLYKNQGQLKLPNTALWIRGQDDQSWLPAFELSNSQYALSNVRKGWVNVYDLLTNAGQPLSSSFQVMVQQLGRTSSNNADYYTELFDLDDGLTIDQLRIVNATNDVMMVSVLSPDTLSCSGQSVQQTVTVKIKNTTSAALTNIPVSYQIDNNTVVTELIPSLAGNSELNYTFNTPFNMALAGENTLNTWVAYPTDNFSVNDSILNYKIRSSPVITSFPYLEKFEINNGGWFTTSPYSSWTWGSTDPIARTLITSSANGNKSWFTTLSGGYFSNEFSYLYSPCFNLSSLSNPVLSFSHISQQERGRDLHLVEYSLNNGLTWQKLGLQNNGTNWYDTTAQYWNRSVQRWHVSSTDLPTGVSNIQFRFLMSSDDFNQAEGIGIDDVHIFEKATVYEGVNKTVSATVSGNQFVDFISEGKTVASINPLGQNLGTVDLRLYINTDSVRQMNNQYYLDRNIVINSQLVPADSVVVRFHFSENDILRMLTTTKCTPCLKLNDAYRTAITQYSGPAEFENGILNDGAGGTYSFIPPSKVEIIPFNNGYYAEFKVKSFSEFWIHALDFNLSQSPLSVTDVTNTSAFIRQTFFDGSGDIRIMPGTLMNVKNMQVRLFNANGQQIVEQIKPYQQTHLDVPNIASGVYILVITDASGLHKYRTKLVRP
jgi:hypothetical protein